MKNKKPTYEELEAKLKETEALLNAIKSGKVDVLLGEQEPLVIQLKSAIEEKERLGLEIKLLLKQWEKTFHAINSCIWILDKEQRVIQSNNFVIEGLECTESDVIGKNCFKLVHKTSSSIPECPLIRAKQSLKRESMEMQENGKWFEITVDPILDENGKYNGAVHILTDISGRKKMESDLQESRVMYQAIFEATGTATMVVEEDGTIIAANNQCLLDTGYSPEELVGTKWTNYVAPESLELMLKYHKLRREDPEKAPKKYEVRLINKKKEIRDVLLDVGMIPGTKQSVVSMLDITERKRAEENLRRSEELLKESQVIAHVGSWVLDIINDVLVWSDEVYRIFGLLPQEFKATYEAFLESVHPDDRKAVNDAYMGSIKQNLDSYEIEHRIVRKDNGEIRFVHEKCRHIMDSTGKIIRSIGIVQDITERKQAEKALQESEKRFSAIFHTSPVAIALTRMEDNTLLDVNEAWERITGYSKSDAIGHKTQELNLWVKPDERKKMIESLKNQNIASGEVDIRRKNGDIYNVLMLAVIINIDGENYLLTMAQDITERKRAEEKILEQFDELKRWQNVILGREERIIELKKEVNELLELLGKEKKYHLDTKNT